MVKLNWTLQAVDDLNAIAEYIARDSAKYARLHVEQIRNRARQLVKFPESGRKLPELETETLRELIEGNYRIIYRIRSASRIDIITVHHSAKRLRIEKLQP